MTYWWVDRVLPGVVASAVWAVALWFSHRRLRHHITQVTARQTEHFDQLTADQTARLSGELDEGAS